MGAYHTLDLELNRKFSLIKPEWDSISLERIELACDPTQVMLIEHSSFIKKNSDLVTPHFFRMLMLQQ